MPIYLSMHCCNPAKCGLRQWGNLPILQAVTHARSWEAGPQGDDQFRRDNSHWCPNSLSIAARGMCIAEDAGGVAATSLKKFTDLTGRLMLPSHFPLMPDRRHSTLANPLLTGDDTALTGIDPAALFPIGNAIVRSRCIVTRLEIAPNKRFNERP